MVCVLLSQRVGTVNLRSRQGRRQQEHIFGTRLADIPAIIFRASFQVEVLEVGRFVQGVWLGPREFVVVSEGPTIGPHTRGNNSHTWAHLVNMAKPKHQEMKPYYRTNEVFETFQLSRNEGPSCPGYQS